MSKKTVTNEQYKGLVESYSIPAEVVEKDGKKYATFGSVVPIHCCTSEEIEARAANTHHYCDIFTDDLLAPLDELTYVRIDETTAEKVFINRTKRILILSSDGQLAQWRCAPTFESANQYVAGAPVANRAGALVTLITARRGNHYAVSNFEGEGGYFETSRPWKVLDTPEGHLVYGDKTFATREELRAFVASLPPVEVSPSAPATPVLHRGAVSKVSLVDTHGRQIAHFNLQNVITTGIDYL